MKRFFPVVVISLLILSQGCGGKGDASEGFPENFNSLSDEQKVSYMMEHVSADSVARFIIYASLGKVEGARIDTLNNATLKAYEAYTDTALQTFSWEFDRVAEELPLYDKMRLRALVGAEDPQGLGLTLGLEYMNQIRVKGMTPEEVLEEIRTLKKASADDPDLYARFLIGFRTVLNYDRNSDMPKEIFTRFLNYDEEAVQEYYSRSKSVRSSRETAPADSSATVETVPESANAPTDTIP